MFTENEYKTKTPAELVAAWEAANGRSFATLTAKQDPKPESHA
jgi:hypothetical protein